MEKQNGKTSFLKKIWYSIGKISRYDEMVEEGFGTAIKYFIKLTTMFAFIIGILLGSLQMTQVKEGREYLAEILPELKILNGELALESEEEVVLDNDGIKGILNATVILNPYIEKEQAVEKYSKLVTEKNGCVVFLKDEVFYILSDYNVEENKEDTLKTYKYNELITLYDGEYINSKEYLKTDLAFFFSGGKNATIMSYLIIYTVSYFIILVIPFLVYILMISLTTTLMYKILKIKEKYKVIFAMSIYSSTLAMILYTIYMVLTNIVRFVIPFISVWVILIMNIYIYLILSKKRKEGKI